jgi:hypothetical protein
VGRVAWEKSANFFKIFNFKILNTLKNQIQSEITSRNINLIWIKQIFKHYYGTGTSSLLEISFLHCSMFGFFYWCKKIEFYTIVLLICILFFEIYNIYVKCCLNEKSCNFVWRVFVYRLGNWIGRRQCCSKSKSITQVDVGNYCSTCQSKHSSRSIVEIIVASGAERSTSRSCIVWYIYYTYIVVFLIMFVNILWWLFNILCCVMWFYFASMGVDFFFFCSLPFITK